VSLFLSLPVCSRFSLLTGEGARGRAVLKRIRFVSKLVYLPTTVLTNERGKIK